MTAIRLAFVILSAFAALPAARAEPAPTPAKRVVIVTGEDGPYHKWRQTAPVLQALLAKDPRLAVTTVEDPKFLATPDLAKYDAVVLHFKNFDPKAPGPEARQNLDRFVRRGGGLVLVHFACGAFQEWPGFVEIAGRVWNPKMRAHDPYGRFRVEIADRDHPVTRGMDGFDTADELYTCLDGTTPLHVLATAVSKVDQKTYPIAFVLEPGKGRTFHCVLGHDVKALGTPGVGDLMRRGTAWTARLEPAAGEL
ncbi:MAG: ThuA domain-containing protein [Thermoguttaceae bacterium]|jgi:type 1 glutamine amidotransferase